MSQPTWNVDPAKSLLVVSLWIGIASACATSETPGMNTSNGATGGFGGAAAVGGAAGFGGEGSVGGASGQSGTGGLSGSGGEGSIGGGGTAGSIVSNNRVGAAQWCQRLAEIQCAAEATCCTDAVRKFASSDECIGAQGGICESTFQVGTIGADSRAAYSIDAAQSSLTTFEMMTSQCDTHAAAWGASPDGLVTMFTGTQGSGASCTPTSMTDLAAGASCTRGLTCIPNTALLLSWTCSPRSSASGPCYADVNCAPGLHCDEPQTRSTCVANLSDGESCSRATECSSLFCEGGHCVPATANAGYCFKR